MSNLPNFPERVYYLISQFRVLMLTVGIYPSILLREHKGVG